MGPERGSTTVERADRIAELGYDFESQPKERPGPCNLCGDDGSPVEVSRRDRYGYQVTLVVCGRCGLGSLCPRLTPKGYAHFYQRVYRPLVSAYHGRRIDAETVQLDQRRYAADLATFLAPRLSSGPGTILDVGGSTGTVAGVLAERLGGLPTVLDPAPDELAVARQAGMETIAGFAEALDAGQRRWDLVLLCQTIDHLLDIRSTLAALRHLTAGGGRAFVDVLDVGFMARRTGSIEGAVKIDHPYYLTRPTAVAFFDLAGYRIVAERMSDDGHMGFLLTPASPVQPDWPVLHSAAVHLLSTLWSLRAGDGVHRS